ncbi:MAG: hypothetical protein ACOCUE_03180, partial [Candidatus Izemoplasmataceae bacterium]
MKKVIITILVFFMGIILVACDPSLLEDLNNTQDNQEDLVTLEINNETLLESYELSNMDLTAITIDVYLDGELLDTVHFNWTMIHAEDYIKLLSPGTHTIEISHLDASTDITLNIVDDEDHEAFLYSFVLYDEEDIVLSEIKVNHLDYLFIPIFDSEETNWQWYMDEDRTTPLSKELLIQGENRLYLKIEDVSLSTGVIPDEIPADMEIELVLWTA